MKYTMSLAVVVAAAVLFSSLAAQTAFGQVSSLWLRKADTSVEPEPGLQLPEASLTYVAPIPPRKLAEHDIVTIRVDELARTASEGEMQQRKNTLYDIVLNDWIILDGLRWIKPSPQSNGDPRARATSVEQFRAQGDMESRESLAFNIAAEVVEIRPNNTVVLEAHKRIRINEEYWEYSLQGICRSSDIGPDNVVLSRDISQLSINKEEQGHVRDSYKRGWLLRIIDKVTPF